MKIIKDVTILEAISAGPFHASDPSCTVSGCGGSKGRHRQSKIGQEAKINDLGLIGLVRSLQRTVAGKK